MTTPDLCTRLDVTLDPDPRGVIANSSYPAKALRGSAAAPRRLSAASLTSTTTRLPACCTGTLQRFGDRHHDLETTFRHHYDLVRHRFARGSDLSPAARLLVGAYFSHEYAVEAAALCNPSIVAHPDQGDLADGQLRVAISLRQIGEGHPSSTRPSGLPRRPVRR